MWVESKWTTVGGEACHQAQQCVCAGRKRNITPRQTYYEEQVRSPPGVSHHALARWRRAGAFLSAVWNVAALWRYGARLNWRVCTQLFKNCRNSWFLFYFIFLLHMCVCFIHKVCVWWRHNSGVTWPLANGLFCTEGFKQNKCRNKKWWAYGNDKAIIICRI